MDIKFLDNLNVAKESIKVWLSNLEQLNYGNQIFAKANELDRNSTDFSKWYYGEGQTFSSFESFQILEEFYNAMYDSFTVYMQLYEAPLKKSLFFNAKEKKQSQLESLYNDIKQNARKLLKSIEIFDEKLKSSPLFEEVQLNNNNTLLQDNANEVNNIFEIDNEKFEFEFPTSLNEVKKEDELKDLMQQFSKQIDKLNNDSIDFEKKSTIEPTMYEENVDFFMKNTQQEKLKTNELNKEEIFFENKNKIDDISKLIDEQVKLKLNIEIEKIKDKIEKELLEKMKSEVGLKQDEVKTNESKTETLTKNLPIENTENSINNDIDLDEEIRRILS